MRTSEVVWTHAGARLVGTLHQPDGAEPAPLLVVLHAANGGRRDYPFYHHLARDLPAAGIAVLLYDRRGSGDSTGSFEEADFPLLAADAVAGIQALADRPNLDTHRVGVFGISQGGWLAPLMTARRPAVQCLVIVSGCGVSPAEQMRYSAQTALRAAGCDGVASAEESPCYPPRTEQRIQRGSISVSGVMGRGTVGVSRTVQRWVQTGLFR